MFDGCTVLSATNTQFLYRTLYKYVDVWELATPANGGAFVCFVWWRSDNQMVTRVGFGRVITS